MAKLSFHRRPMPIFAEYRPLYKIAQLLLILYLSSRGGKSSFIRLQLFNWILKDEKRKPLLSSLVKSGALDINVWGFDPSLNSAVQFALAERLVERCSNGILLTERGKSYVKDLIKKDALEDEVKYFTEIGKGITESMISRLSDSWG